MEEGKNEVKTKNSEIKKIDLNLHEVLKSVCKIIYKNKFGTGFFIKFFRDDKELLCLMTNEHIIRKEMIESNEIIDIKYNYEKKWMKIKLDEKERYILYNKEMDITIIEIIPKDKIKDKYFLLPNINNIDYINKDIYIVQYPGGNDLSYSEGKIKEINNYELIYDASTQSGSSGSPILLKDTTEIIGIHKQGNNYKKENNGTLIYSFIQILNYKKKTYENGEYYIGEMLNNLKHGKGILYYKNGTIKYDGNFVKDKYEGDGKYIWEDGEYYIGQWLNDLKHGKGKEYYKNGTIKCDGNFVNGKREGDGKYIFENGNYYIGRYLNGLRNGKGILYYKNGNIKYDGNFVNSKYEGDGKYIFENGNYYIGQWLNGLKHGKGILYYKNGTIKYDGSFCNDKFKGDGKYIFENGEYYIGQWLNDLKYGKGKEYYKNGNIKYDGDFVNDKYEGDGKYIDENGEYYIGQWLNGLKHGKGILFYKNGNIKYDGNFVNDKFEGNN